VVARTNDEEVVKRAVGRFGNARSPDQWKIISKALDFKKKSVVDLGCGHADMLFHCALCGLAHSYLGIDRNIHLVHATRDLIKKAGLDISHYGLRARNIENFSEKMRSFYYDHYDVSICFSVLPYLSQPLRVLKWMRRYSDIAFLEIQSENDGPGTIPEEGLEPYLLQVFGQVENVGHTTVKEDRYRRIIWKCQ
jgi:2-polyprenyl-3-methyl-5-hydroxy-6-metoxy-1,4-benzoquinol methylase